MRTTSRGRLRRALAGAGLTGVLLTGCGSASEPSDPSGVDQLSIPTPSPRPADFVSGVGNPWLAWQPGSVTTYDVRGPGLAPGATATVEVGAGTEPVAGLDATVVTTTAPDGSSVDHYAQDRAGNVWWVGRAGAWEAGVAGAEAGLLMPAGPRVGDGFRTALVQDVAEEVVEVLEAPLDVPGQVEDPFATVRLESVSELEPGTSEERTYVEGRGLLRLTRTTPGSAAAYVWEQQGS